MLALGQFNNDCRLVDPRRQSNPIYVHVDVV